MKIPRDAVFVSRLWTKPIPGDVQRGVDVQRRVDDISKQFTGAGWKHLPQELVDKILDYLLGDLHSLKACSLTCKLLFGATRHLVHQRLRLASRPDWMVRSKLKGSLFDRPEAFELLVDANRSGLLRYTRHLTFKIKDGSFTPRNVKEHLPHLRSITNLDNLTLDTFHVRPFIPVFHECFGMFTNTLRHLDIQNADGTERQVLYIICQFPLLEDLSVTLPVVVVEYPECLVPTTTQSPPLRGKLFLARTYSRRLLEGLAAFPGRLNFRSLELFRCNDLQVILEACGRTVTSISYLWCGDSGDATPLDLKRSVVLERFEFNVRLNCLSQALEWIHRTLRTITSPLFSEFVVSVLNVANLWDMLYPITAGEWGIVDASLDALAERNPYFRVVFRMDFSSPHYGIRDESDKRAIHRHVERSFPLVSSKGLVRFEHVPRVTNRFWKRGVQ